MKSVNNIEKLIKNTNIDADADMSEIVFRRMLEAYEKSEKKKLSAAQPNIWRIIMKNRITKIAVTAVIIVVVGLSVSLWDKSIPAAYAIEQTIKACSSLRYLHTKYFHGERDDVAKESWFEFDDSGQTKKVRINWSEWFGKGEVVVWKENETKSWYQKQNSLRIFNDEIYTSRVYNMMEAEDPKMIVKHLYDQKEKGQVKIEIDETSNKAEPIVVTATYLPESPKYGDRKVLFVDRGTNLPTRMELYVFKEGEYTYYGVIEYFGYNVPIDEQMFSLADEIPKDAHLIDTRTQDIGLAQGDLTNKEIAVKVVQEFIEALIAKDYTRAGLICGLPPAKVEKGWGQLNIVCLISVGEPVQPEKLSRIHPKRLYVPCTIEVEKNGQTTQQSRKFRVAPVIGRRDRWENQGG